MWLLKLTYANNQTKKIPKQNNKQHQPLNNPPKNKQQKPLQTKPNQTHTCILPAFTKSSGAKNYEAHT